MTVIVQQPKDSNGNPQPMVYDSDTGKVIVDSNGYVLNGGQELVNVPSVANYVSTPKTQTSGIQEAHNYSIVNGNKIKLASGQFQIYQTITISHGITIIGSGTISFHSFNPYPLSDLTTPIIPESASVIVNNSSGDAIDITVNYEAVNLDNFSILMTQTGGTGIKCSPPDPSTQMGMVYSNWGEISVYSEVGDPSNYAFWFDNIGQCTFGNLQSYAMLELHIDNLNTSGYNYGNSTFLHVYGSTAHLSSAPTNQQVAILYSGSGGGSTNLINFVYLQIDLYGQTSTYYGLYVGQNTIKTDIDFLDMELNGGTIGDTSLVLYNNGELYINKITAYNGGTFYVDEYGTLTIEDALSIDNSSIFTNNGGILYVEHNLGRAPPVTINTTSGGYTRIGVNPRYVSNLPAAALSANPPVSATVYQNTLPYDIEIDLPVYATTSGTAGYVTIAKGASSTPSSIGNQYVSGDTSDTSEQIIRLRVPAGWYYEFTGSGVTFGTASVFAE